MEYLKDIHKRLVSDGFMRYYEFVSPVEDETNLHYTVYKRGGIEVSVCDSHSVVDVFLNAEEDLRHLSYSQLLQLDKLINKEI